VTWREGASRRRCGFSLRSTAGGAARVRGGDRHREYRATSHTGYRTVYWTIDTLDWQTTATPASITRIVMDNMRNGAIVLMHVGSQVESETLDGLMTKIEQQGYQIVSVSEVLQ